MAIAVRPPHEHTHLRPLTYDEVRQFPDDVVDPVEPRLTVHRPVDGRFVELASVAGDDRFESGEPFAVAVSPAALVG